MWRRVLLVLMVVWTGALAAEKTNEKVFKRLCNITSGVTALMKQSVETKGTLEEALYGGNGGAQFNVDGTLKSECGWLGGGNHRSQYCSHIQGGYQSTSGNGCFGHSLVGTFLCLCVPGNDRKDLCGLGIEHNGVGWGGWGSWGGPPQDLFQKVWDKVNRRCFKNNTTTADRLKHVENLKSAVKTIKEDAKQTSSKNGYYLGDMSNTNGVCDGSGADKACVTYQPNGNEPHIPWIDKILEGIKKLEEAKTQSQTRSNSVQTDHHQQDTEYLLDEAPESNDEEGDEESQEPAENPGHRNTSKMPRPKRKRRSTTTKKSTEKNPNLSRPSSTMTTVPFYPSLSGFSVLSSFSKKITPIK